MFTGMLFIIAKIWKKRQMRWYRVHHMADPSLIPDSTVSWASLDRVLEAQAPSGVALRPLKASQVLWMVFLHCKVQEALYP